MSVRTLFLLVLLAEQGLAQRAFLARIEESGRNDGGRPIGAAAYYAPTKDTTCLLVMDDGSYVLEHATDVESEKPEWTATAGSLSADDLRRFKTLVEDDRVKALKRGKPGTLGAGSQPLSWNQRFIAIKREDKVQQVNSNNAENLLSFVRTVEPLFKFLADVKKKAGRMQPTEHATHCQPARVSAP